MFDKPPYWHTSGDVLLLVTDRGTEYKFRVHRYILSLHSVVWEDTFQLGAESKDVSAVDDLPVIPLDDSLKDVCALLSAFYLGIVREDIRETHDLDAALGILKLAHKYEADRLSTVIHSLLQESWPLSRIDYFALSQEQRQRATSSIKLIKAASATQSTALLPAAFYELAATPAEKWTEDATNLLGELSSEDLSRLFLGKNRMNQSYKVFTAHLFAEHASDLILPKYCCCHDRSRFIRELTVEFGQSSKLMLKNDCVPCGTCREWLFPRLKTLEVEIWKSIPAYFNLPSVEMAEDPFVRNFFG